MALTPLQRHQARSMGMNVDWAEDLLSFIGIRPDLANYPMEDYLPEGVSLSDENFVQAFDTTVEAIQAAGGGILRIPAGTWNLGTAELEVLSAGRNKPVYIEGAGVNVTILTVDEGYSGTVFHLSGEVSLGAVEPYYDGGIANLTITCATVDASTDGVGIRITSCIGTQFLNVVIRNFLGGTGFESELGDTSGDTCQYIQLWNVTVSGSDVNYALVSFVNCQGYSVFSTSAVTNDFLCDDAKATFYGGNIQSSPDSACIELAGNGGCQLVFHDFYYEGFADTIFKLNSPAITSNQVAVFNLHLGGSPLIFANTDAFNELSLNYINLVANADVILKARNGATTILLGCKDPVAYPLKFDLDAASAAQTVYMSNGCVVAAQTLFVPRAATGVVGPALFVDIADGSLNFKGAGGTVTPLAPT